MVHGLRKAFNLSFQAIMSLNTCGSAGTPVLVMPKSILSMVKGRQDRGGGGKGCKKGRVRMTERGKTTLPDQHNLCKHLYAVAILIPAFLKYSLMSGFCLLYGTTNY